MTVLDSITKDHKIRMSTLCPSPGSPHLCLEHPHGRIRVRLRIHGTTPLLLSPEPFSPYSTRAAICWTHVQAMSHCLLFKSGRSAVRCSGESMPVFVLAITSLCTESLPFPIALVCLGQVVLRSMALLNCMSVPSLFHHQNVHCLYSPTTYIRLVCADTFKVHRQTVSGSSDCRRTSCLLI